MSFGPFSSALPWQEVHLIKFALEVSTTFYKFFTFFSNPTPVFGNRISIAYRTTLMALSFDSEAIKIWFWMFWPLSRYPRLKVWLIYQICIVRSTKKCTHFQKSLCTDPNCDCDACFRETCVSLPNLKDRQIFFWRELQLNQLRLPIFSFLRLLFLPFFRALIAIDSWQILWSGKFSLAWGTKLPEQNILKPLLLPLCHNAQANTSFKQVFTSIYFVCNT